MKTFLGAKSIEIADVRTPIPGVRVKSINHHSAASPLATLHVTFDFVLATNITYECTQFRLRNLGHAKIKNHAWKNDQKREATKCSGTNVKRKIASDDETKNIAGQVLTYNSKNFHWFIDLTNNWT